MSPSDACDRGQLLNSRLDSNKLDCRLVEVVVVALSAPIDSRQGCDEFHIDK